MVKSTDKKIKHKEKEIVTVDIVVLSTLPVKNDTSKENATPQPHKQSAPKNRRKNKHDRRKSVREGIIVSLSVKKDRRVLRDRRKSNY